MVLELLTYYCAHSALRSDGRQKPLEETHFQGSLNMSTGMSSSASRLAWHDLYQAALFETDRNKVPERIAEAEQAILSRIKELFVTTADHIEEDVVLDDALYALRALRNCVRQKVAAA